MDSLIRAMVQVWQRGDGVLLDRSYPGGLARIMRGTRNHALQMEVGPRAYRELREQDG